MRSEGAVMSVNLSLSTAGFQRGYEGIAIMNDRIKLTEKPVAEEIYLIAGWHQWADAGNISSGLPQYLIEHHQAHKIGEMVAHDCYLFQLPGTHHLLRPQVKLEQGYRTELSSYANEFYYWGDDKKGLVIFLGEEPHLNAQTYTETFLDAVEALGVKRVAAVGGVYGTVPYDRERDIACVYSLKEMKEELAEYAVRFSDYEGGATIGTLLAASAEAREIAVIVFYAFAPSYDLTEFSASHQSMRVENDYKAWYDLMKRLNHLFGLEMDLSDLERKSRELFASVDAKVAMLEKSIPGLRGYLDQLAEEFSEHPFTPLGDVWEGALREILEDLDE